MTDGLGFSYRLFNHGYLFDGNTISKFHIAYIRVDLVHRILVDNTFEISKAAEYHHNVLFLHWIQLVTLFCLFHMSLKFSSHFTSIFKFTREKKQQWRCIMSYVRWKLSTFLSITFHTFQSQVSSGGQKVSIFQLVVGNMDFDYLLAVHFVAADYLLKAFMNAFHRVNFYFMNV